MVSDCCLKYSFHKGSPKGAHRVYCGLDTYVTGKLDSKKVIVCFTDIFGNHFINMLLLADRLGELGDYLVLVPDILLGDPVSLDAKHLDEWRPRHTPEITTPIVLNFLKSLKAEQNPQFIGSIGYCFGARFAVQGVFEDGLIDASCIAHPSIKDNDFYENVTRPLLISAAEIDGAFPSEDRRKVEDILMKNKIRFQSTLFQGTSHGFAVKGDFNNPDVVYAANKAAEDHVTWFNRFANIVKL